MTLLIRFTNGKELQGVMLALWSEMVRVAVKGADDAVEFRLINQTWVSEDCEPVTIQFVRDLFSTEQSFDEMPETFVPAMPLQPVAQRLM